MQSDNGKKMYAANIKKFQKRQKRIKYDIPGFFPMAFLVSGRYVEGEFVYDVHADPRFDNDFPAIMHRIDTAFPKPIAFAALEDEDRLARRVALTWDKIFPEPEYGLFYF